ncbi:DUF3298 and DUF4163 domain-containing protein [Sporolactobacillus sp. CPB3-1]|uniref:DUF3298 and DUF4163 domain-containing protein n=1 Tax=Sporolactobacillus mangiferae TaxID=2940498 RepID=A0ABT0MDA0_9BACL|nr:DUF3298 and DUF4163 domain-containing protein [Sporolactobacillus mangiferae]MCL1632846.1 DUF3298 and DUF4163 domain-containing protein [Sporolactobacillus mangiferae]
MDDLDRHNPFVPGHTKHRERRHSTLKKKSLVLLALCLSLSSWLFAATDAHAGACLPVHYRIDRLSEGIHYPVLTSGFEDQQTMDRVNQVFRRHAEEIRKTDIKYKKQYAHDQMISAAGPYYAHTQPSIRFNDDCLLSVSFLDESFTGGAHGMHKETVYNYDTRSGRHIHLNEVIQTKKELKKVNTYLMDKMKKLKNEGRYDFFLDAFKGVDVENGQFYFDHHGIVIIFQEYEVAPYSNGIIHLKVPYHIFIEDRK